MSTQHVYGWKWYGRLAFTAVKRSLKCPLRHLCKILNTKAYKRHIMKGIALRGFAKLRCHLRSALKSSIVVITKRCILNGYSRVFEVELYVALV